MRTLLERKNVDPNTTDENGRTPLSWASQSGNEGVVKILLERAGVDPNMASRGGLTPLS